ncbi:MAG: hypothetical protein Q9204_002344 [Flavoplaca sp. TL-2023a]
MALDEKMTVLYAAGEGVRSSCAPLSGRTIIDGTSAIHASENGANEKTMLPRSPGYLPFDKSAGRLEFQDSKRSIDELKELARTSPPDQMVTKPTFTERKAMADLTRTHSGRRRRILEQIGGGGDHAQKPLRRLFRLNRSATTSDLKGEGATGRSVELTADGEELARARECLRIASKHSSGGYKYTKIAISPKMYKNQTPSTYQVNFLESKAKGKSHNWIYRKSQPDANLDGDANGATGHISHSSEEKGYGQEVMDEFPHLIVGSEINDPAKSVTNPASNGYSPSKGIPQLPEHGLRDFTAATLATAQARARAGSKGHLFRSPERQGTQSRQRESPIRKHGNHFARRRPSSKGPHSIPIKFQLRPQRASFPKTPRTSFDEPVAPKVSPPNVVKETAVQAVSCSSISPIESSPAKSGRSFIDDCHSDAESGTIMNAQRAEFIQGQGAYAYHHPSSSRQPPKPGPAPTRALPSLPEGHDSSSPKSRVGKPSEDKNMLPSETPSGSGSSPKQQKSPPKSPPKRGHRYRLSPVKNTVPSDSRVLKPSPTFTEVFPQPPSSSTSLARKSSEAISPRTRTRPYDGGAVVTTGRALDLSTSPCNFNSADSAARQPSTADSKSVNGGNSSSSSSFVRQDGRDHKSQNDTDAEKDNLYMPWHESRIERVRALKIRDMERARQGSVDFQRQRDDEEKIGFTAPARERGGTLIGEEIKHPERVSSLSAKGVEKDQRSSPEQKGAYTEKGDKRHFVGGKIEFSPIIVVAEQPPCLTAVVNEPCSSDSRLMSQHNHHHQSTQNNHNQINPSHTHNLKPNGILHPTSSSSYRPTSPHNPHNPIDNRYSNSNSSLPISPTNEISALESRLAAMEKKNILLERAFLAVIDASCGFGGLGLGLGAGNSGGMGGRDSRNSGVGERGSGYLSDGGRERERMSAMSEGDKVDVLSGRVDEMLELVGDMGRRG